jgi:DNA-binding NarL/FixJ family response regulator
MKEIIIVDDHAIFRSGLKAVLEQEENIKVLADFGNGPDFLSAIENVKPDLVLMDIKMPDMNGVEVSEKALELYPDLKILVLSMHDDLDYYNALIDLGVKGFVLKDEELDELTMAINKILAGENYFSQTLMINLIKSKKQKSNFDITAREKEILQMLAKGFSAQEISDRLYISTRTVDRHRSNLFIKTDTNNSLKLLVFSIKNNLIEL